MICNYYLTYECSCKCEYCRIWQDESIDPEINSTPEQIKINLECLKSLGVKNLNLMGGDPFVRKDLPEILSISKKYDFNTGLYTNGMIYPDVADAINGLFDMIYISLDSPIEDEHNRIKGQECFKEALDAISCAVFHGVKTAINFVLTRDSIRFLPEMLEIAQKHKAFLYLNPVHHVNGLEGFEPVSVSYILRYVNSKQVLMNRAMMELLKKGGNKKDFPICKAVEKVITISPDDYLISPCTTLKQARIPINGNLDSILSSDLIKGYKKLQGKFDHCKGCTDADYLIPSFSSKMNKYRFFDLLSNYENRKKIRE